MIITRTPFRVSFFGGGTDFPIWYRQHGGAVLTTTIDKYCYISCRKLPPFFEHKHRIIYSQMESVRDTSEIKHPSVKAVLQHLNVKEGLEIHHDGDLPARSGLGSSSAFTNGLLLAVKALQNEFISKEDLALKAIHVEQDLIGETVGSQDQVATAHGGFNRIDFRQDGSISVSPMIINQEKRDQLERSCLVFFTGLSRFATEIEATKMANMENKSVELMTMRQMVDEACTILQSPSRSLDEFGRLLHDNWKLKRSLSTSVSNSRIDELYNAAMAAGATGGKILGAGGGGFMLFFVPQERQKAVSEKLHDVLHVNIKFENTGSKIALYDPQL